MKAAAKRIFRDEQGQSIVEAAIVLPILLLLICGILDFGWIFSHQIMLNNAARDSARYAIVNYSDVDLETTITSRVIDSGTRGNADTIQVDVNLLADNDIQVSIQQELKVLTPLAGIFVSGQTVTLEAEATMWAG